MKTRLAFLFGSLALAAQANAVTPVEFPAVQFLNAVGTPALESKLRSDYGAKDVRLIRAEKTQSGWAVRVFSNRFHKFESHYLDTKLDKRALVEANSVVTAVCPDASVQFISFAPNDDAFEVGIAQDVANAATSHGLKTVMLARKDATKQSYLNYLACPNLLGDFYDGDANPTEIVTNDGVITHDDLAQSQMFNYKVTHIWLACEAYNNPMLGTMIATTKSQKYAAGINDLEIGPSDHAAACAMKAALDGQPMTAAFQDCYNRLDQKTDQWGFSGDGSDLFGHSAIVASP